MNPRRWVERSAWSLILSVVCFAAPAGAQLAEFARTPVELPPDPVARSARLLGMGRLTLLFDRDNHLDFWDFAGNPVGLFDADSVSVLDVRPATQSSSAARDVSSGEGPRELQNSASRDSRIQFEAIRRPGSGTAYGLIGEVSQYRADALYSVDSERRSLLSNPLAIPVIAGKLPFFDRERMRYAIHGLFGVEDTRDEYRRLSRNSAGDYIDHSGTLIGPPEFFTPDEYFVRRLGGGLAVSYEWSRALKAAIGGRITSNGIVGTNEGDRYGSENRERRPIFTGQATFVGKLGSHAEWGADGQAWSSSSQTTWVFTISPSGGPGPARPPLTGRGDLSKRDETGTRMRLRGRWLAGSTELGASFGTLYRKVEVTPTPIASTLSFNRFRQTVFSNPQAADTLALPNDVLSSDNEQREWEMAAGLSRPLGSRTILGAEYHYVRRRLDALTGQGALAEEVLGAPQVYSQVDDALWDARGGIEYRCTPVLAGRLGYIFRSQDRDQNTEANEFISHTVTGGIGIRPAGAHWSFDTGYAFEWGQADYGAPERPRSTRQQLAVQLRWDF